MVRLLIETVLVLFCLGRSMTTSQGGNNLHFVERPFQSVGSVISENGKTVQSKHHSRNPLIPPTSPKISSSQANIPGRTPLDLYMPRASPQMRIPSQTPSKAPLNNSMNNIQKIPTANIIRRPSSLNIAKTPSNPPKVSAATAFDYYLPLSSSSFKNISRAPSKGHLRNPVNNVPKLPTANIASRIASRPSIQNIKAQTPNKSFAPSIQNNANINPAMIANAPLNQNFQRLPSPRIPNLPVSPQPVVYRQPMINNPPAATYRPQVMSFRPLLSSTQKSYSPRIYNQVPYKKFSPGNIYQTQPTINAYTPPIQTPKATSNNFALAGEAPYPDVVQEEQPQNAPAITTRKSQVSNKKPRQINAQAEAQSPQEGQALEEANGNSPAVFQPVEQQMLQNQPPSPTAQQNEAYGPIVDDQPQALPASHFPQQNVETINQHANPQNVPENFPQNTANDAQQHMTVAPLKLSNEQLEPLQAENLPAYQPPVAVAY